MLGKDFFVKELNSELSTLTGQWIEGVKPVKAILGELEDSVFSNEVPIIYNNQFELVFLKNTEKVEFRTTRSNQLIDRAYMNKMLLISQSEASIESLLKTILYLINNED